MSTLKFCKVHPLAVAPVRTSTMAAGYDLSSVESITIPSKGRALVSTGLKIQLPEGTYGRIAPRSGLALRYGIDIGAGVIDCDYRGIIKILLFNLGDVSFVIKPKDRIAQLICENVSYPQLEETSDLEKTIRNENGFGSSSSNTTIE